MSVRVDCLAIVLGVVSTQAASALPADGRREVIVGALEPERLPETSVWDNAFAALHDLTGGKTDPRDPQVRAFVRGNLFLSDDDAGRLLRGVATARGRMRGVQARLDRATTAEREDDAAVLRDELARVTLAARDDLLSSLSPRGRKALLRWIAIFKQGMVHTSAN